MHDIHLKRAYEPASPDDGTRILVERLWPRGVSKAEAALAAWDRDIAPSPELRKWYAHDPARWEEFRARYRSELEGHAPGPRAAARARPERPPHPRLRRPRPGKEQRRRPARVPAAGLIHAPLTGPWKALTLRRIRLAMFLFRAHGVMANKA